jgi:putative pyruvate formate lyase activating enzyme
MWKDMDFENANTLEFVGGEPVVNLLAILEVLNFAPYSFNLPIVWNTNGYMSNTASSLLQGIVDVYLPDLKYGNDDCAKKLSGVSNYSAFVKNGIKTMLQAGIRTIVRILVLPGHIDCCHEPSIKWLSQFKDCENLWVSVLDQYVPEHRAPEIKELNRCPVPAEIKYVENMIEDSGLKDVNKNPAAFWK